MTHAILQVTYTGDRSPQTVTIESADALANRLDDLRANPRVEEIAIYTCERRIRSKRVWEDTEAPKRSAHVVGMMRRTQG